MLPFIMTFRHTFEEPASMKQTHCWLEFTKVKLPKGQIKPV